MQAAQEAKLESGTLVALTAALYDFVTTAERGIALAHEHAELTRWANDLAARFRGSREPSVRVAAAPVAAAALSLQDLAQALSDHQPCPTQLRQRWHDLSRAYEALHAAMRELRLTVPRGVAVGHVKPRNLSRNLFHVSTGVGAVVASELVPNRLALVLVGCALLAGFVFFDVLRRWSPAWNARLVGKAFGKIVRPGEAYQVPSCTWYLLGLLIGAVLLPQRAIELGALVLAFGDPAASLAGKTWGRRKIYGDKSLAGSCAFVLTSFVVGLLFLMSVAALSWSPALMVAAAVAAAGALVELGSGRLDDNFTVPLAAGSIAALLML